MPTRARRLSRAAIALTVVAVLVPPTDRAGGAPAGGPTGSATEWVVGFDDEVSGGEAAAAVSVADRVDGDAHDADVVDRARDDAVVAELTSAEAVALTEVPGVAYVEREGTVSAAVLPNDALAMPSTGVRQWHLDTLRMHEAWNLSKGSGAITVAVLDQAVDASHPDLTSKLEPPLNAAIGSCPGDISFGHHATHVAGIVGAATDNSIGVAGVGWNTKVLSVKVLCNSTGVGSFSDVATGIDLAVAAGADVINLSLTADGAAVPSVIADAIEDAIDAGVVVVGAAGNDNDPFPLAPASHPDVISVASLDPDEGKSSFSNFGTAVDISAPGSAILSTCTGCAGGYGLNSGTSMAAPMVSGAAALVLAQNPGRSPAQVRSLIEGTAWSKGAGTVSRNGVVDPAEALGDTGSNSPRGSLGTVRQTPSGVTVKGWTLDPNRVLPIAFHVYANNTLLKGATASAHRSDIAALYPDHGPAHGFDTVASVPTGVQDVCVYGIDEGPGGNRRIGCKTITVRNSPIGALDRVTIAPNGFYVSGWALDLNTAGQIPVHVYLDGRLVGGMSASGHRSGIGAAFPEYGPNHGFSRSFPAAAGKRRVCVWAIDTGPGSNQRLGCRSVTVTNSPFGVIDSVSRSGGTITAKGWTLDPNTPASIPVHVYVNGTLMGGTTASKNRPGVANLYPPFGPKHGYTKTVSGLGPGPLHVCVWAIDIGPGSHKRLGCRGV